MGKRAAVASDVAEPLPEVAMPDLAYIKERIQIVQVARDLGMHVGASGADWTMTRCFRPEKHKHGDRTPSLGFIKNRYMCFACDDRTHSNVDLVMAVKECDLRQAVRWFDDRYPGIPRTKVKLLPRLSFRAGVDELRNPDDLVRAGLVPHLTDSSLRVFVVLAAFRDGNDVAEVTYETIMLRSGIGSKSTVSTAIKQLVGLSILMHRRRWSRRRHGRDSNQYIFTFDDPRLFGVLAGRDLKNEMGVACALPR
jgi:hypothetical protein